MPKKHGPVIAGFGYTGEDGLTYVDAEREYEAWAKMFPAAAKKAASQCVMEPRAYRSR
jgi:hypothetical protein